MMPVSETTKEKIMAKVDSWKRQILAEVPPMGSFNDLDLREFSIVHHRRNWTSGNPPKVSLTAQVIKNDMEGIDLVILSYPTIWNANDLKEMLFHNKEIAVFDKRGLCFKVVLPHFVLLNSYGDIATLINTAEGRRFYIDAYHHGSKEKAPKIDFLHKWPKLVVRDDERIRWVAERFFNFQLFVQNMKGEVSVFAPQLPLWKRLIRFDNIGPKMKLDVTVKEDIPKEIVLFLAALSV
ncbi:MAG: hypothetical protein P1Q69_18180 [Candidatus Thorarchaeota archaeon]|nr:hypothetical protein [Candidatus Thorarchaeota archaeon]